MAVRESPDAAVTRWEMLELVQNAYRTFTPFLEDVMAELGFTTTAIQRDIAAFLEHGPHYLMIQAQRGQAKTTITAAFAVWQLLHHPRHRILILSAGGTQANEISTLVVRIILTMEVLACLRPDRNAGDRTSVEAFDVHHSLKGLDKSPSVACIGITGNLQGKRADLLIADDIESQKNALTEHQRAALLNLTRDFPSICATGRIVYLGTPQSVHSIYNTLPGRGYTVRIWTGRYPTPAQIENYGGAGGSLLAPMITRRLEADPSLGEPRFGPLADQGAPLDPELPAGTEDFLCKKEIDQGPSYFQLQHMLNTRLSDADRYPLRLIKLQAVRVQGDLFPLTIQPGLLTQETIAYEICGSTVTLAVPSSLGEERVRLQGIVMYVDPAGGGKNGDETGYAVTGFLNGNIWLLDAGGVPGGYSVESFKKLAGIAKQWRVNRILIEKNFGHGAYLHTWLPILRGEYADVQSGGCALEEVYETGQKELRIIDTLEPVMARGALIVNDDIPRKEPASLAAYPLEKRSTYSLFHQLAFITREKQALAHDDRLDALAGAVRYWVRLIGIDQEAVLERAREAEFEAWRKNPLGRPQARPPGLRNPNGSLMNRYKR